MLFDLSGQPTVDQLSRLYKQHGLNPDILNRYASVLPMGRKTRNEVLTLDKQPNGAGAAPTFDLTKTDNTNRYLWSMLLARIYNLFPLLYPECGAEMQIIAIPLIPFFNLDYVTL